LLDRGFYIFDENEYHKISSSSLPFVSHILDGIGPKEYQGSKAKNFSATKPNPIASIGI